MLIKVDYVLPRCYVCLHGVDRAGRSVLQHFAILIELHRECYNLFPSIVVQVVSVAQCQSCLQELVPLVVDRIDLLDELKLFYSVRLFVAPC